MHDGGGRDEEFELFGQLYAQPQRTLIQQNHAVIDDLAPPAPPPGAPVHPETRLSHLPDGRLNTYNGQPPNARYNEQGQRILPGGGGGARFIPPDEYKEFLQLGHGGIFDLDLDNIDVAPWRERGADVSSYFNYGLDERSWRKYVKNIRKSRLEQHLQNKIEAYGMDSSAVDVDLPPEVRRAIGGWEFAEPQVSQSAGPLANEFRALPALEQREAALHFETRYTIRGGYRSTQRDLSGSAGASEILTAMNDGIVDTLHGTATLQDLQKQVTDLQREYKMMVESGTLTPQRNVQIQQQMLELKRRIVHHSAHRDPET